MLRQGLDIRIGQTLSMTPQLQQAIRLLQLSYRITGRNSASA